MAALQILCILGLVSCGFFARRRGVISAAGTSDMARLMVALIYPALILTSITRMSAGDLMAHILMPLLAMGVGMAGFGLGLVAVRFMKPVRPDTARMFLFHCLMNNYIFLPLPLVLFLYGDHGVALLVFSSVGFEILLWTLGVFLFTRGATHAHRARQLFNPPLVVLVASLAYVFVRDGTGWTGGAAMVPLKEALRFAAQMLGQATVALSMIIAGSRFAVMRFSTILDRRVWLVSALRLVVIPLVVIPILYRLPLDPTARGVIIVLAVMPSAMVSVLFSERYGGDSEFIAGGLLLTHLWALVTVPLFLALAL